MASALSCFDPLQGQLLAVVTADSRVRVWDTATGTVRQQYVDPKQAQHKFASVAWHRQQVPATQSKKRSSSGAQKASSLGLLALGSEEGSITIWDLQVCNMVLALALQADGSFQHAMHL